MPNSPTIVSAALSDKELQDSINKMVANFDKGLQTMLEHSNEYVGKIQESLQKIGNTNFGAKSSNDGGVAKRTKSQNAETDAVEKNIAARDKQIKKNQEVSMSYDQMAAATQKATSGSKMSVIETYDMQIEMFKNRLREVRQDIDIFNAAIGSGKKTQIEWGQQGLKQANAEAEKLMRVITTLENQRGNLSNILAPQGHTIQNYVNSLQKANPELAQLNEQFKRGQSLLQQGKTAVNSVSSAFENGTNTSKKNLDELNAYVAQSIQRERERRDSIRQTGLAARETADQLIRSAHQQASAEGNAPIKGARELRDAIEQMRRAYFDMSSAEKMSPIGIALNEDIKRAKDAMAVIQRYNQSLFNSQQNGANKISNASTLNSLRESLKNLTEQYNKLTVAELNAGKGDALIQHFQDTTRAAQILQRTLNRPVSLKSALSGDERTLDDIAYKMQRLRAYKQGIDLTKPNAANEIKQVDEALARLQKDADKWMSKSQEMIKNNTALGRSWNYMKNRLAFYFTVGASTSFIKNLIEVRSQYEMNERALGILINSAERGTQIFNELSQMALVSPYTLIELSTAAKQLTAYDIAAKDVVDITRRLADMASAVGIPIERLTYALGQIKAYGYLNSRDARMFANAGIPLVKQLSDYYTQLEGRLVSTADVYDRIKKKTIDYEQVVQVINKMTDEGGKFFDFQAKMADTLKVRLANLTLAWNNMLNDMGSSNQGVLTTGIGLLRDMFLHWKDLESAISKVATAFGIYKTAQLVTLIWTGRITTAMGVQELVGKKLQARFASLTVAQKGFVSAATAGWAALAFVVADAWLTISRNMEEIEQLNKSIADGAKESYEAIDKMLHSSEMVSTRLSAAQGKLSDTDAAKAWEMLREQIELSAASSKELIAQLLKEPDINKRVTESFNLAEKIEEANRKLSDLNDSLDVSQNSILGGLLGEGLAEDIDDYNARLKYTSDVAEWAAKKNRGFWENAAMGLRALFNEVKDAFGSDANEAQDEIKNFAQKAAQTIKDELGEEGIKDKIQVNEAIARVVRGMEQQFPQIRGKGKVLFETIFYDTMANEFKGAVDSQAYYYEKFLEQLKKDHASAFSGVTEDINKETFKWSSAQIDAIQKTADKVKKDLPAASQGAIDEILRQLNSTDFKVRIVAEMATTSLDNVQKQFREKFIEKPWIADSKEREKAENEANQRYGTLMRKNTESNAEYEKRISDERKKQLELSQKNADIITKNKGKQEEFSKAVLADAQKQKEAADDWLKAAKDIEDKGGYNFSTKGENSAARKAAKQAESELAKALKDELSTIDKVRSIYKDLTKEGMSHANAVERATKGWDETVSAINKVFQKNGLQKLDLSKFAGIENPRELLNILQSQLETLVKRGASTSEIRVLQTKIQTVSVEADKYDLTMITKGLNSELDRLKEEYELAVALDADPELGSIFADWMGFDMDDLPRTAQEYANQATNALNKAMKERKADIELPNLLNITDDDLRELQNRVGTGGITQTYVDEITKGVKAVRDVFSKELTSAISNYGKLLDKYGDYVVKVRRIEEEAATERKDLVMRFGTNEQKSTALKLHTEILEEKDPVARQKLVDDLENLTNEVSKANPVALKINASIGNSENEKLAQASFEEFQKSREWIIATGDLATLSRSALGMLINEIEKYKKTAKNLTPKQIKAINNTLKQLKREVRKNNPFAIIKNTIEDSKERMADYQSDMDAVMNKIVEYEKKIGDNKPTEEQQKDLDALKQEWQDLYDKMKKIGEGSTDAIVEGINAAIQMTKQASSMFTDMFEAFGNDKVVRDVNRVFAVVDKVGQGAAMGAAVGGGWGAIIGGATGLVSGLVTTFADQWSGNKAITESVQEAELAVKKLTNAYKMLEDAAEHAFGTAVLGAKEAIKANKELQLVELKRQLALEEQRSGKHRDDDRITELKGQVIDLENEIRKATKETLNDLLGISSHGDFFEDMISEMIDAFKSGEDAMKVFEEKWSNMIDNMIMKTIVSQVLQNWINSLEKGAEDIISKYTQAESDAIANHKDLMANILQEDDGDLTRWIYENDRQAYRDILKELGAQGIKENPQTLLDNLYNDTWFDRAWDSGLAKKIADMYKANMQSRLDDLNNQLDKASLDATGELIDYYGQAGEEFKANYLDVILDKIKENWNFGQDNESKLSQLQQGIQGITEDQAGALEAYWNANTQQQYVQSDLLREIRNLLAGGDADIQTGVQAQMLLQLQQSYQVQMSIENILQSVLNPSGRAFSVELIS